MTPRLHSQLAPLQALASITSRRLGPQQLPNYIPNNVEIIITHA